MKTKFNFIVLLISASIIFSCSNNSNEKQTQTLDSATHEEEHNHDEESESLSLNDGKKWIVNPEMMVHIKKMKDDVSQFEKNQKKDYKNLAKNLNTGIDSLTSSCTMEGKAHDELHKWLVPFIELVDEFSKNAETSEVEKLYSKIKTSFEEFDKFFE